MMSARSAFRRPVVHGQAADAHDVGDHVSPAMSAARIARPLTPRMSVTTCVNFTWRVFERLLQALRVPRDLADQLLAGPRQVAQFLDRGRRHEAAPNQPVRQQVGDPGRVVPVALAARNVPDVLRVGEHQRERLFVFEDVPHRLPVHAGRLHRHVRAARLGQPGRQFEQTRRRSRKLPVLGRDLPTRSDAHARVHAPRVDIQPGAPGVQDFHPSPPARKGAGVESAGTKSTGRAHRKNLRSRNTGCSRDSGSN